MKRMTLFLAVLLSLPAAAHDISPCEDILTVTFAVTLTSQGNDQMLVPLQFQPLRTSEGLALIAKYSNADLLLVPVADGQQTGTSERILMKLLNAKSLRITTQSYSLEKGTAITIGLLKKENRRSAVEFLIEGSRAARDSVLESL